MKLHRTGITPAARSPSTFSGVRVMAATTCPSANMSGIRRTPMTPVAPARKILIALPPIYNEGLAVFAPPEDRQFYPLPSWLGGGDHRIARKGARTSMV